MSREAGSSPAGARRVRSPILLTPRSKIRALLHDSDDSDAENASISLFKRVESSMATNTKAVTEPNASAISDEDEDEDVVGVRPRGRVARKMFDAQITENKAKASQSPENESAYARVKRQLLSKKVINANEAGNTETEATMEVAGTTVNPLPIAGPLDRRNSPGRASSPVSRSKDSASDISVMEEDVSDEELPSNPLVQTELEKLVARKRREREAAEQEQEASRKKRLADCEQAGSEILSSDEEGNDPMDASNNARLTTKARPPRKASKKALEEMNRETQRMSRNQQLTHQAKTKKKITKQDLFARFNYKPEQAATDATTASSRPATPLLSPAPESPETPASSPPPKSSIYDEDLYGVSPTKRTNVNSELVSQPESAKAAATEKSPAVADTLEKPQPSASKTQNGHAPAPAQVPKRPSIPSKFLHLKAPQASDSDDDLEIVRNDDPRMSIFDRISGKKPDAAGTFQISRAMAQLKSPNRVVKSDGKRRSMNGAQLDALLREKARKQAVQERQVKLDEWKAQGKVVQSHEEREKEQLEIENLLEKARVEAGELSKREKLASKGENGEAGGIGALGDTSDEEDGDWNGEDGDNVDSDGDEGDDEEDGADIVLSGSEDEDDDADVESVGSEASDNDVQNEQISALIDDACNAPEDAKAKETAEPTFHQQEGHEDASDGVTATSTIRKHNPSRKRRIVEDDDDDDLQADAGKDNTVDAEPTTIPDPSPGIGDQLAAFGLFNAAKPGAAPMGLTQAFMGSMASGAEAWPDAAGTDARNIAENSAEIPDQSLPLTFFPLNATIVENSQEAPRPLLTQETPRRGGAAGPNDEPDFDLNLTQLMHNGGTQFAAIQHLSPVKDIGFAPVLLREDAAHVAAPPSTTDTVLIPVPESPVIQRKGRLRRRAELVNAAPGSREVDVEASSDSGSDTRSANNNNVFEIMRKAAKKPKVVDSFDKSKSKAKEMIDDQALESEDEYAGMGGMSDDEAQGDDDDDIRDMIDESDIKVDEGKIAAYYASKDRAEDEKRIEKLYKDLANGGLRRKRGADFDLAEDSDEEVEQRRLHKQREAARMRRALLEDEAVGKIAENPKKSAFFRSIEDTELHQERESFFLDDFAPNAATTILDSQPETGQHPNATPAADATATDSTTLKRKRADDDWPASNEENRPPAHLRRTRADASRKPTSLAQVRHTLSLLVDDPNVIPDSQPADSDDSDNGGGDGGGRDEARAAAAHKKRAAPTVVNRISLSRTSTSTSMSSASESSIAMAFQAAGSTTRFLPRAPTLLRRVTSGLKGDDKRPSLSLSSSSSSLVGSTASGESEGVRRGGSKKSSINYQAREMERRQALEAAAKRKNERMEKVWLGRRNVLGALEGAGNFE